MFDACDGAVERDDRGFNKFDVETLRDFEAPVKQIAESANIDLLGDEDYELLADRLFKYRNTQLWDFRAIW